jgi:hypothetical protein
MFTCTIPTAGSKPHYARPLQQSRHPEIALFVKALDWQTIQGHLSEKNYAFLDVSSFLLWERWGTPLIQ